MQLKIVCLSAQGIDVSVSYDEILAAANAALEPTAAAYTAVHDNAGSAKVKAAVARAWKTVHEAAELVLEADQHALKRSTFRGNDLKELIGIGVALVEGSMKKTMEQPRQVANLLREIETVLRNVFRSLKTVDARVEAITKLTSPEPIRASSSER